MRADDDVDPAGGHAFEDGLLFRLRPESTDHVDADGKAREPLLKRALVLKREDRRRREKRDLFSVDDGFERRPHRDFRFAVADVSTKEAIHRRRRFHVARDVLNRGFLIDRQVVLECVAEFLLPVRIRTEGVADDRFSRGIELQQFLGHVAHGFLHARLGFVPRRAAQTIERRGGAAGVFLDEIEPLERNEELVVGRVPEFHELLRLRSRHDRQPLQPDELPDAVVCVDDQVARLEIAEIGNEGSGGRLSVALARAPFFLEQIGFREDDERG